MVERSMSPWYVWLVGSWTGDRPADDWAVVGVFTTREKARDAAYPGCFIVILPIDEKLIGNEEMSVEWIE